MVFPVHGHDERLQLAIRTHQQSVRELQKEQNVRSNVPCLSMRIFVESRWLEDSYDELLRTFVCDILHFLKFSNTLLMRTNRKL